MVQLDETQARAERAGGKQMRPSHLSEGVGKRPLGAFSSVFLVLLGLCCGAQILSSCGACRLLVEARRLLEQVGSAVAAPGLSGCPAA